VTTVRQAHSPGTFAAATIADLIRGRDCAGAVDRLKRELKEEYREVELMAGTMYEHGVCVRRDWERAIIFYTKAHGAGHPDAAGRLAAGFADPANGPDIPGALWWARQGGVLRDRACAVSAQAEQDPDSFVAELNDWPRARREYCNYLAGVLSTISSEVRYPGWARSVGLGGEVVLRFLPAVPRVEMDMGELRSYELQGWVDADEMRDRGAKRIIKGFENSLGQVADRALRRYPQPAGIPEQARAEMRFNFRLVD
jgi:TPR repeat protein